MSDDYEPDEDMMQSQRREWKRLDDLAAEIASERATMEPDIGKFLEAAREIAIKPGHQHARNAMRAGMDDEYSNRMKARYGGEW